jgi:hypothetical protein
MKLKFLLITLFSFETLSSQWVKLNLASAANAEKIFIFSKDESYILQDKIVDFSSNAGVVWKEVLKDSSHKFQYIYRYNGDSVFLNCYRNISPTAFAQRNYRIYKDGSNKQVLQYTCDYWYNNILKFNQDTFLNIFNELNGSALGISVEQYPVFTDVDVSQTWVYILYNVYFTKLQNYQLLGDTLVSLSNRIDYYSNELYPVVSRNNIRSWTNDTTNQIEMKILPPSRSFWAFSPANIILLGENYLAEFNEFPMMKNIQYYPDLRFKKIYFISADTGFIVGKSLVTNRGILWRTTDAGKTWQDQHFSCPPVNDIVSVTPGVLLAACDSGVVLRTINSGGAGTGIEPRLLTEQLMIYPNPANEYIRISTAEDEVITVYNALGETVLTTREKKINTGLLKAGVYLVRTSRQSGRFIKD